MRFDIELNEQHRTFTIVMMDPIPRTDHEIELTRRLLSRLLNRSPLDIKEKGRMIGPSGYHVSWEAAL